MKNNFKIAAAQLNISKPISSVIKDIKKYMCLAKKRKAEIICFPEESISAGPKKNKEVISKIKEYCRLYSIWCIIAANLKEKKYSYKSALIINAEGEIFGKHKKVHVLGDGPVMPGSKFNVYSTPFCKIGIAICWDVSNPVAIKKMAKKGAKIIFCPMYWCYDEWSHKKDHKKFEKKILQSLILARAYESLAYIVFCNPVYRNENRLTSYTAIAEPHKIVKEIFGKEGLIVSKVNLRRLQRIRKKSSS